MFLFGCAVGFVVGCAVTGEIAHRWPHLFAQVVSVANQATAAVNAEAAKVVDKVSQ